MSISGAEIWNNWITLIVRSEVQIRNCRRLLREIREENGSLAQYETVMYTLWQLEDLRNRCWERIDDP